jgi:hypothetical protein
MKKSFVILALLCINISIFSQIKYTGSGNFGIGTTSPTSLLQIVDDDPVVIINGGLDRNNIIRLVEGNNSWLGAYLKYEGSPNKFIIGTHTASGTNIAHDKNVFVMDRGTGQIELNPISTAYNFQSFVTKAPNLETQCYNVKLGTSNNFWVDGDGDVWHSGLHTISDVTLKENISDLKSSMEIINKLRPVSYNFRPGAFGESTQEVYKSQEVRFGLVAQEVESVIPELVERRGDSLLSINYIEIIPILIDALQSQQEEIETLKDQLNCSESSKKASNTFQVEDTNAKLFQNRPNPFIESTTIAYAIVDNYNQAEINIYNLSGKQLRKYPINSSGSGSISIPGSELEAGIYIYNMIIDGVEISSRKMILTE